MIINHLLDLDAFFQSYIEKFIELYPGPDTYMKWAFSVEEINSNLANSSEYIRQILCLKNAKLFLSNVGSKYMEATALDLYKQSVENLVYSLKLYVDDIKSLHNFYQYAKLLQTIFS